MKLEQGPGIMVAGTDILLQGSASLFKWYGIEEKVIFDSTQIADNVMDAGRSLWNRHKIFETFKEKNQVNVNISIFNAGAPL